MSDRNPEPTRETKAERLKDLLQCQTKSVVSRMLVKNGGGSVTLFAFDKGEGQSLLIPAGAPHALNPVTPFRMLLVMILGDRGA